LITIYHGDKKPFDSIRIPEDILQIEYQLANSNPIVDSNYTHDDSKKRNLKIGDFPSDQWYCDILKENLLKFQNVQLDNIVYITGPNTFYLTPRGIKDRDELVFKLAKKKNIPISYLISGHYDKKESAPIIKSLKNIYEIMEQR